MDFSMLQNNIVSFIVGMLYISATIGSVITFMKQMIVSWIPSLSTKKTYTELFLPITPYLVGLAIYLILKLLKQQADVIQVLLAASFSDTCYSLLKKSFTIYQKKQDKELKEE